MMKVVILDGNLKDREFPLRMDFNSIGREEGVVIRLAGDTSVSRRHAVIRKEYGRYILEDLGSTNGSFIYADDNEEQEVKYAPLSDGSRFRIGKTMMKIVKMDQDLVISAGKSENMEIVRDTPGDISIRSSLDPENIYPEKFVTAPADQKGVEELNHKIKVFYEIGTTLGKIMDLDQVLEKILDRLFDLFPAQRGFLMLFNEETNKLETRIVKRRDADGNHIDTEKIEVSSTIINHVMKEKKAILSDDARIDERFGMPDSVFLHDIRATLYVPMMTDKKIVGILCIDSFTSSQVFGENDLRLLSVIANQAAQAIENARLHQSMKKLFVSSIGALANAIEARDVYTRGLSLIHI